MALDFAFVVGVAVLVIGFHLYRPEWGLHWAWEVPAIGLAVLLIGIAQHRIALMGHEGSHYLLVPNRKWNDLLVELLIFYPLFSSVILYRKKHLGHHLYPNDPSHDPNLAGGKTERIWAKFPMSTQAFIRRYYLHFFWPPFVLRNLLDLFLVHTIGSTAGTAPAQPWWRKPTLLGIVYFIAIMSVMLGPLGLGFRTWPVLSSLFAVALIVWSRLPATSFGKGGNFALAPKWTGLMKLVFYTLFF